MQLHLDQDPDRQQDNISETADDRGRVKGDIHDLAYDKLRLE